MFVLNSEDLGGGIIKETKILDNDLLKTLPLLKVCMIDAIIGRYHTRTPIIINSVAYFYTNLTLWEFYILYT